MTNMFSGNREKKIPKTFKDCYKSDNITVNLWIWCERLEKWGGIFCIILGIVGIFSIISDGIQAAEMIDKLEYTYNIAPGLIIQSESVFEVVLDGILRWSFYCFLEYCAYHVLALFVGSLATIVQHTKITANLALYNSAKSEDIIDDYEEKHTEENAEEYTEEQKEVNIKCKSKTHELYISEIRAISDDTQNAHWIHNELTDTYTLVCNHCNTEIAYARLGKLVSGRKIRKYCTKCKRIQPYYYKTCYNCENDL